MFIFPVQLTTSRIGNLIRLIHTLLYVTTIHTYMLQYVSVLFCFYFLFFVSFEMSLFSEYFLGGLSLSDESFPNEGARGAFAKPSRSLQEGSAKPSRSVSSRRLRGASKAQPRTLRGGLRTLRGGCTYRRLHEDALEGSRGLLEGSVNELRVPTRSWL